MGEKVFLQDKDGKYIPYNPDEIIRILAADKKCIFFLILDGKIEEVISYAGITWNEEKLKRFGYLRIHRCHIVNPKHITSFKDKRPYSITLTDEEIIFISKETRDFLKDILGIP